jgi:hypothetical protein
MLLDLQRCITNQFASAPTRVSRVLSLSRATRVSRVFTRHTRCKHESLHRHAAPSVLHRPLYSKAVSVAYLSSRAVVR